MSIIREGDWVILYYNEKKSYTVRVEPGRVFHTTHGSIDLSSLIGLPYGSVVKTNVGEEILVSRASFIDRLWKIQRTTQVIYPKDLGYMLIEAGIGPGSIVVEAGTGTGFLTAILAWYVRPSGRVYTYEIRKDFYDRALKNFEMLGILPYVTAKNKDIRKGIDEEDVDAVLIDLPSPWEVVEEAYSKLANGGSFTVFVPTTSQVEKTLHSVKKAGFKMLNVSELIMREYQPIPGELRPQTLGVLHTGYIITARKL
ncbi:MAG: tRNA (adenine-N1)-methyltransferase [Infirmifilum sp.]